MTQKASTATGRGGKAPFRCTECDVIEWHGLQGPLERNVWPTHCKQTMAMLPGDEANELAEPIGDEVQVDDFGEEAA